MFITDQSSNIYISFNFKFWLFLRIVESDNIYIFVNSVSFPNFLFLIYIYIYITNFNELYTT